MSAPMVQEGEGNFQAGRDITNNFSLTLSGLSNKPSITAKVIAQLCKEISAEAINNDNKNTSPYDFLEKIKYNSVIHYKPIIDQYGNFGARIESICDKLDIDKPNTKVRLFDYINHLYINVRIRVCFGLDEKECLEEIRKNADKIIQEIEQSLFKIIENSKELEAVDVEDIKTNLLILIVVAFINCTILEKPIV